jgi:NADP-dependent 3-hydroxy acid dehydrogenase YdfG
MPAESRELTGTVVAITGASSGMGAATSEMLLEAAAKVAVQDRRRGRLDAIADQFGANDVLVVAGNPGDPAYATDLVSHAVSPFGRLDTIVINAGIGIYGGILDASDNEAVYAATKFAQVGLAGALDREVRPEGIRVSTNCPAGVHTEFAVGAGRADGDPALDDYLQPEDVAHTIAVVLQQPRRVRTTQWQLWSIGQRS